MMDSWLFHALTIEDVAYYTQSASQVVSHAMEGNQITFNHSFSDGNLYYRLNWVQSNHSNLLFFSFKAKSLDKYLYC